MTLYGSVPIFLAFLAIISRTFAAFNFGFLSRIDAYLYSPYLAQANAGLLHVLLSVLDIDLSLRGLGCPSARKVIQDIIRIGVVKAYA